MKATAKKHSKLSVKSFAKVVDKLAKLKKAEDAVKKGANPIKLEKRTLQRNKLFFVNFGGNVPKEMSIGATLEYVKAACMGNFGSEIVMLQIRPKSSVTQIMIAGNAMVRPNGSVKVPVTVKAKMEKKADLPEPVKKVKVGDHIRVFMRKKFWPGTVKAITKNDVVCEFRDYEDETWPLSKIYPAK